MDGGAWQAIVHGVTKSQTRLSDFTHFSYLKTYIIQIQNLEIQIIVSYVCNHFAIYWFSYQLFMEKLLCS